MIGATKGLKQLKVGMKYNANGILENFEFGWVEAPALLTEYNFSEGFVPTQVLYDGDWQMFSNSNFNGSGRVVIRNMLGQEFIINGGQESTDGDSSVGS